MHKVKCTCPEGIQLRLLGGTVYLKSGQEAVLTDTQITHSTVKVAIRSGNLQVEPVTVTPLIIATETPTPTEDIPVVAPKRERGSKPKVVHHTEE